MVASWETHECTMASMAMLNDQRVSVNVIITLQYIDVDPENNQFLVETSLPTPICQGLC